MERKSVDLERIFNDFFKEFLFNNITPSSIEPFRFMTMGVTHPRDALSFVVMPSRNTMSKLSIATSPKVIDMLTNIFAQLIAEHECSNQLCLARNLTGFYMHDFLGSSIWKLFRVFISGYFSTDGYLFSSSNIIEASLKETEFKAFPSISELNSVKIDTQLKEIIQIINEMVGWSRELSRLSKQVVEGLACLEDIMKPKIDLRQVAQYLGITLKGSEKRKVREALTLFSKHYPKIVESSEYRDGFITAKRIFDNCGLNGLYISTDVALDAPWYELNFFKKNVFSSSVCREISPNARFSKIARMSGKMPKNTRSDPENLKDFLTDRLGKPSDKEIRNHLECLLKHMITKYRHLDMRLSDLDNWLDRLMTLWNSVKNVRSVIEQRGYLKEQLVKPLDYISPIVVLVFPDLPVAVDSSENYGGDRFILLYSYIEKYIVRWLIEAYLDGKPRDKLYCIVSQFQRYMRRCLKETCPLSPYLKLLGVSKEHICCQSTTLSKLPIDVEKTFTYPDYFQFTKPKIHIFA